ncbi:MAG: hypothetical protein LBE65_01180 [Synergistaceae bacterium]|nr:hypothetical protein [Synergistaceae bacterium]
MTNYKRHFETTLLLILGILFLVFAGGCGSSSDEPEEPEPPVPIPVFAWDQYAETEWFTEYESNTSFSISTAPQLAGLALLVNNGQDMTGKVFAIFNDINLSGHHWVPIGRAREGENNTHTFKGTFDGNGYVISNIVIQRASESEGQFGFFGVVKGGEVRDVNLRNVSVAGVSVPTNTTGGFVGANYGGTITRCSVTRGIISGRSVSGNGGAVGGFAGENSGGGKLLNCSVKDVAVELFSAGEDGDGSAGCFIGVNGSPANEGHVNNCRVTGGSVSATGTTGVIVSTGGFAGKSEVNGTFYGNKAEIRPYIGNDIRFYGAPSDDI